MCSRGCSGGRGGGGRVGAVGREAVGESREMANHVEGGLDVSGEVCVSVMMWGFSRTYATRRDRVTETTQRGSTDGLELASIDPHSVPRSRTTAYDFYASPHVVPPSHPRECHAVTTTTLRTLRGLGMKLSLSYCLTHSPPTLGPPHHPQLLQPVSS